MSTTLRQIAALIPAEFRKEILDLKMIENAIVSVGNNDMHYLATLWKEYVDPQFEPVCPLCLGDCLKNWKQLLPYLEEIEQEENLLDSL